MAKKRVWNVEVVQDEGLGFTINRGCSGFETKARAEAWLDRNLKHLRTRIGNIYPYRGRPDEAPVEIVSTRIYSVWEEQERPAYIYDY